MTFSCSSVRGQVLSFIHPLFHLKSSHDNKHSCIARQHTVCEILWSIILEVNSWNHVFYCRLILFWYLFVSPRRQKMLPFYIFISHKSRFHAIILYECTRWFHNSIGAYTCKKVYGCLCAVFSTLVMPFLIWRSQQCIENTLKFCGLWEVRQGNWTKAVWVNRRTHTWTNQ